MAHVWRKCDGIKAHARSLLVKKSFGIHAGGIAHIAALGINNIQAFLWQVFPGGYQALQAAYAMLFIKSGVGFVGYAKIFSGIDDPLVKFKDRVGVFF